MKVVIKGNPEIGGIVENSGSKNSAVAIIPAAILSEGNIILRNIPDIEDVRTLILILKKIGYHISFLNNILIIKRKNKISFKIKSKEVEKLRGSYYFMGSFLGRLNKVIINKSGGCDLGSRPIDFHLKGFTQLGASIKEYSNKLSMKAKSLKGCVINLDFPSVGATINIMLVAVKAAGITKIVNCAKEPEVIDVGNFLIAMGANISGLGTNTIIINGVKHLHGCDYKIISDRIEAGTYLILGALTKGKGITVKNTQPELLSSLINILKDIGCLISIKNNNILITTKDELKPFQIITNPYPDFPTDLGQLMAVLATQISGLSTIKETIFSNRFSHIDELKKMGSDITISNNTILIQGKCILQNANLKAFDLRGAAALVLAAIIAKDTTTIENIETLLRGYENPIKKLSALGLDIKLIK